jgi:hypothetical protein
MASATETEIDSIIDSMPVMLAQHGHSYSAKVAREIAAAGFCAAKKTAFFTVFVCTLSPNGAAANCLSRNKFGCVPPRITIRLPSKNKP